MLHRKGVPPRRVGSGRHQADNGGAFVQCGTVGLGHPTSNLFSVRRIHEHDLVSPRLFESIILPGEVTNAFGIGVSAARVEREPEFLVQGIKQPLRSRPQIRRRREMNRHPSRRNCGGFR